MSVVKFQTFKAALLHELMRILGLLCLVALSSKILLVLDVHHHCANIAVSGTEKDKRILLSFAAKPWKLATVGSHLIRLKARPNL